MARQRLDKTLADYVAIAISPALLIVMVGSLMFFLLEVLYSGGYEERLTWIMSCFVVAIVLIARISIEQGSERAMLFAGALALAVGLALLRFVEQAVLAWIVMAIVWWTAHKLTFDCTLIDEDEDASGEGLLQVAGLEPGAAEQVAEEQSGVEARQRNGGPAGGKQSSAARQEPDLRDDRFSRLHGSDLATRNSGRSKRRRKSAPGVWVVYYSLAALPMFAIGQLIVPLDDLARRRYVFWLVAIYLASALGLLLTTSFLGLRRYLRQRRLQMPAAMTGVWLGTGAAMILVLLALCTLVPRPQAEYELSSFSGMIGSADREASEHAMLDDSAVEDESGGAAGESPSTDSGDNGQDESSPPDGKSSASRDSGRANSRGSDASGSSSGDQRGGRPQSDGGSGKSAQDGGQSDGSQSPGQSSSESAGQGKSQQNGKSPNGSGQGKSKPGAQGQGSGNQKGKQTGQQAGESQQPRSGEQQRQQQQKSDPPEDSSSNESGQENGGQRSPSPQRNGRASPDSQVAEQDRESEQTEEQPPAESKLAENEAGTELAEQAESSESWLAQLPDLGSLFTMLVRWILNLVMLAAAIYFGWRYRREIKEGWLQLLASLRELWQRLFGGKQRRDPTAAADSAQSAPRRRLFSEYPDPFHNGAVRGMSGEELLEYSFSALEAWAFERGHQRLPGETPLEFADRLGASCEDVAAPVKRFAGWYARVAYARATLTPAGVETVRALWQSITATVAVSLREM